MFTSTPIWTRKLKSLCWKVFHRLENNGNSDFIRNGESVFIDALVKHFAKERQKQRVIFDVGANVGAYANMLLERTEAEGVPCHLHLFEPTGACLAELYTLFGNRDEIRINDFGLSDSEGSQTIYYDREKSGLASLYRRDLEYYRIHMDTSEEISLKRAADYIDAAGIEHIDFIKIDIEGHELKAFEGFGDYLHADFVDFVQFEYGGANLDSHTSLMALFRFFEARGFRLAKIMPSGLAVRDYDPRMDNFVYSNYVAFSEGLKL